MCALCSSRQEVFKAQVDPKFFRCSFARAAVCAERFVRFCCCCCGWCQWCVRCRCVCLACAVCGQFNSHVRYVHTKFASQHCKSAHVNSGGKLKLTARGWPAPACCWSDKAATMPLYPLICRNCGNNGNKAIDLMSPGPSYDRWLWPSRWHDVSDRQSILLVKDRYIKCARESTVPHAAADYGVATQGYTTLKCSHTSSS